MGKVVMIDFSGPQGSGKSTLMNIVRKALRKENYDVRNFPARDNCLCVVNVKVDTPGELDI